LGYEIDTQAKNANLQNIAAIQNTNTTGNAMSTT